MNAKKGSESKKKIKIEDSNMNLVWYVFCGLSVLMQLKY